MLLEQLLRPAKRDPVLPKVSRVPMARTLRAREFEVARIRIVLDHHPGLPPEEGPLQASWERKSLLARMVQHRRMRGRWRA